MSYKKSELNAKLNELISLPAETEWVEFKEAKSDYNFDDIGIYFSALSNEANLNSRTSLLQEMRREGKIYSVGHKRGRGAMWKLSKT